MNRRHFLRATAAAVGALTLDPERLLWVPGQRTYFNLVQPRYAPGTAVWDALGFGVWDGLKVIRYGETEVLVAGTLMPAVVRPNHVQAGNVGVSTWSSPGPAADTESLDGFTEVKWW